MQLQPSSSLGTKLFLLRVLKNPRQLGAIAPSSRYLGELLAKHVTTDDDSPIIELGGGTGSLTRVLIAAGVAPSRIYNVELDVALANYLRIALPEVNIIQGNAADLENILPPEVIGKTKHVISGLPMLNIPEPVRKKILKSSFNILEKEGSFLQYTYSPRSSINAQSYGLIKKRLGTVFRNLPPATVWQYTKE